MAHDRSVVYVGFGSAQSRPGLELTLNEREANAMEREASGITLWKNYP